MQNYYFFLILLYNFCQTVSMEHTAASQENQIELTGHVSISNIFDVAKNEKKMVTIKALIPFPDEKIDLNKYIETKKNELAGEEANKKIIDFIKQSDAFYKKHIEKHFKFSMPNLSLTIQNQAAKQLEMIITDELEPINKDAYYLLSSLHPQLIELKEPAHTPPETNIKKFSKLVLAEHENRFIFVTLQKHFINLTTNELYIQSYDQLIRRMINTNQLN